MRSSRLVLLLLVASLACGGRNETEEATPKEKKPVPISALATAPLAGQTVAVIPLTILVGDDELMSQPPFNDHLRALDWADSIITQQLLARAPEPKWVFPRNSGALPTGRLAWRPTRTTWARGSCGLP